VSPALLLVASVLGLAILSMPVYAAARGGSRDTDAETKGSRLFLGLGDFLLHWFLWFIGPVERTLLRLGTTPDVLNAAGLLLGLLSGILAGSGRLELAGWAIVGAGLCDVLDGRLARARGTASPYGKFIDSTLDRFVEAFAFLGFVHYYRERPLGAFLAAAGLAGSQLVSYAQARGETVEVRGSGGLMQRAERLVLTALGCLVDPSLCRFLGWREGSVLLGVLGAIALGAFATAVYRTAWIAQRLRR
jgi:phosphatidylglycerophosphate synthase